MSELVHQEELAWAPAHMRVQDWSDLEVAILSSFQDHFTVSSGISALDPRVRAQAKKVN